MVDLDIEINRIGIDLGDVLSGLPAAIKLVRYFADRTTRSFQESRDAMFAAWAVEEQQQAAATLRQLEARSDDVEALKARLDELVADPEFARVRNNYGYEAYREAIDERRRMLAFASAGSINLELSVAQLARVERTVRELDSSDVLALARVAKMADPPQPPRDDRMNYRDQLQPWHEDCGRRAQTRFEILRETESLPVLSASGCVLVAMDTAGFSPKNGLRVTELGARVLRVLHGYLTVIGGNE